MSDFFSPIRLLYCHVLESHVRVSEEGPAGDRDARLTLETADPALQRMPDGSVVLRSELTVDLVLATRKGDEELFSARVRAQGAVGVDAAQAQRMADQTEVTLRANVVSLLYGQIRTYLEMVTGMSPMGKFTLPTIDPYAYLSGVAKDGSEQASE